ncbi:MAG: gliding motility-associated C-terminal domain-containing protein [Prevotellaceae bacterium]|jgi:gliding motility-associated-like protein|nr:gliding motility-associated C-terminal domain-containing protein [Prevotellaceae bacterium]
MIHRTAIAKSFCKLNFAKKSCIRFVLAIGFFLFLAANPLRAQDLIIGGGFVEQLIVLENTTGGDIVEPVIKVQLGACDPYGIPNEVHLENTSWTNVDAGLGNGTILSMLEGSNTNVFYLKLTGGTGIFPAGKKMTIPFSRRAICKAEINPLCKDIATIDLGLGQQLSAESEYSIWGAYLNPEEIKIIPNALPNIVAGRETQFSAKIVNTGQHSYAANFKISITHQYFETPRDIILEINGVELEVAAADIATVGNTTSFIVTTEMLIDLGLSDGALAYYPNPQQPRHDELFVKYKTSPTIERCGNTAVMKISTTHCENEVHNAASDLVINVLSPGFILSSFSIERRNYDFPDALDNGTVNGTWSSATPLKNLIRNGDTLELSVTGTIRTSSLISNIDQLYAAIKMSDGAYDEFSWNQEVLVKVKKEGNAAWDDYAIVGDVQIANGLVSYRFSAPGTSPLEFGDEVQLVATTVMKNDAATNGSCILEADIFTAESNSSNRYPTNACKALETQPLNKVVVVNNFVAPLAITGSCLPVASTAIFRSSAVSPSNVSCTNCFTEEFRSNYYVRELEVYVPAEGTINSGTITIGSTPFTFTGVDLPTPVTATFTDGSNTYSEAKRYTFILESKYGTYGVSPLFTDEQPHEVTATFDIVFENSVNTIPQSSAILYVAKPANPSIPSAVLPSLSAVQTVNLPVIYPQLNVVDPPGAEVEISPLTGEVVWNHTVANNTSGAALLDNLSLTLEDITGGVFSSITVKQAGYPAQFVTLGSSIALNPIPAGAIHTLEIKGIVKNACSNTEKIKAVLAYKPCGGQAIELASKELTYKTPPSAIQVSASPSSNNLTMCEEFEVSMVISALKGVVKDPIAKLALPINTSSGFMGIEFIDVRELNGSYGDYIYTGDLDTLVFDLNAIAGISELHAGAGQDVTLIVKLKPTCFFPINSRLTSYAYGKNFCDTYNSEGSGIPVPTGYLTIDGLQSTYTAQVAFGNATLTFDKSQEHKQKETTFTIKKLSGGNVGVNDMITLNMPALLRVMIDDNIDPCDPSNSLGATCSTIGTGINQQSVVIWPAPASISTTEKEYKLTFIMDNPTAYGDLLNGTITAAIINKVAGLPCGTSSCPNIDAKAGEGTMDFRIVDLFPALAKDVSYQANSLMNYVFTYTFTLKNFGDLLINNVRLEDDLSEFYTKGTVSAINIVTSSAGLMPSTAYNGSTNINLLASGSSSLQPNEIQTVTLSFSIVFNEDLRNQTFTISNTSIIIGSNENGTDYEDTSNNGTDPDLTDDTPTITDPIDTNPPIGIVEPVVDIPPPGFAITVDGVECFEGNEGALTPLEFVFKLKNGEPLDYDLCFTVYTRDSIATIQDNDYIKVPPTVVCIPAGDIRSNETIAVTIVGDDKFEKDEPFILDVKPAAHPMECKPPIITILNDDAQPNIIIDDINLEEDEGPIPYIGDFSQYELTSTTERTKFSYCVTLNMPAPQPLVLKVNVGNENDTAIRDKDYYSNATYAFPIPVGENKACFTIEVEPDAIPENDEVFTMSFTLEADGVAFYEEVKRTVILDDDEFSVPGGLDLNEDLIYCEGDDASTQSQKIQDFVSIPSGYEVRWYATPTSAVQIPEPVVDATQQGATYTFWVGYYNPDEDYEVPINKRAEIKIRIQSEPQWDITTTPISPMTLQPGQMVSVAATSGLYSYDFVLNGTSLTPGTTSSSEIQVHRDKFSADNVLTVEIFDYAGCSWIKNMRLAVNQAELPNAFIPEGDNPDNKIFLEGYDLRIFNRWGHLLYQGTEGWDGRYKGSYVAPGTYYYVVNLKQDDGTVTEEKSFVMVVSAKKK